MCECYVCDQNKYFGSACKKIRNWKFFGVVIVKTEKRHAFARCWSCVWRCVVRELVLECFRTHGNS